MQRQREYERLLAKARRREGAHTVAPETTKATGHEATRGEAVNGARQQDAPEVFVEIRRGSYVVAEALGASAWWLVDSTCDCTTAEEHLAHAC